MKTLSIVALLICACGPVSAQPVLLPSDLAVSLTAHPDSGLLPGQATTLTLSVTNHGPVVLELFELASSPIFSEFDLTTAWTDCPVLILTVVDLFDGFYYYYSWLPVWKTPLAVDETRECHLRLPATTALPSMMPLSFGLADYWTDPNPGNNEATVVIRRAAEPTAVPTLSIPQQLVLLLTLGALAWRSFRTARTIIA